MAGSRVWHSFLDFCLTMEELKAIECYLANYYISSFAFKILLISSLRAGTTVVSGSPASLILSLDSSELLAGS